MKTWTQEEIEILNANYNRVSNEELCALLPQKTYIGIYKKAYNLGLRKAQEIEFLNRSNARKGEKGANWKGGTKMNRQGYRLVLAPHHHRADTHGYVLEHILVFEQSTGIEIPSHCCIHHLNGNKSDNRIENLCMMTKTAHTVMHHLGAKRTKNTQKKKG